MCNDTISKSLKELVEANLVNYTQGNSFKKANLYTFPPPELWNLPKKKKLSKKPRTPVFETTTPENDVASTPKNDVTATPKNVQVVRQKAATNKSNGNNSNLNNNNSKLNESKLEQGSNSNAPLSVTVDFYILTAHLKRYYEKLYKELLKIPFSEATHGKLTAKETHIILDRYIEYAKVGGSLHGLIKNEFTRLKYKKTVRHPEPRFLASNDSLKIYFPVILEEVYDEDFKTCFGPIPLTHLLKPSAEDKTYQLILKAFRLFLMIGSIEGYVTASLKKLNIPQLGSCLFKYALAKEAYNGNSLSITKKATDLYFSQIGDGESRPFQNELYFSQDNNFWAKLRFKSGDGFKEEIESLMTTSDCASFNLAEIADLKIPESLISDL